MRALFSLLIACISLFSQAAYSQATLGSAQQAAEQLNAVQAQPEGKEKADGLVRVAQWYADRYLVDSTYADKGMKLALQARAIAAKLKYERGQYATYLVTSKLNTVTGKEKQGVTDAEAALRLAVTLKDEAAIGDAYVALCDSKSTPGYVNYHEQISMLQKAIIAFRKINDRRKEADCHYRLADNYLYLHDHKNTGISLRAAVQLYKEAKFKHIAHVYDLLGVFYRMVGNLVPAVDNGLLAVKTAEEEEIPVKELGLYYCNLGMTYEAINDYSLTKKYLDTALAFETAHNNLPGIFQVSIYLNRVLCTERKYKEALRVLTDMARKYPDIEQFYPAQYLARMVNTYRFLGEYDMAMVYARKLEVVRKERYDDLEACILIYPKLIIFYATVGYGQKVNEYMKEYLRAATAMNLPASWSEYYAVNYYVDSVAGNYSGALENFKKQKLFGDSIVELSKMQLISELNVQYETAQKDKDLQSLKTESKLKTQLIGESDRVRNNSVILAASLMALAIIIYIGYRRKQRSNRLLKLHQDEIDRKNETLEVLVREKEWLVKEIHHRVKNNLHMVVGLLASQTEFLKNKEALNAITDSQNRIQAMSIIHQKLYQVSDMSSISMPVYIQELTDHLKDSFRGSTQVAFNLSIMDVSFSLAYSVPIGLILNEAITNAMKYAFPGKKGIISITLDQRGDEYHLSVKDNGVGLPAGFDAAQCESLGIKLMNGLSGDIGGTFNMHNDPDGLRVEMIFPLEQSHALSA